MPSMSAEDEALVVKLRASCCIQECETLKQELLSALDSDRALTLDASELTRIDTAGLQLLCALARTLDQRGQALRFSFTSPTLQQAAQLTGLSSQLGLA